MQEDKCIDCAYISMWEGECTCIDSKYFARPVYYEHAACECFEREIIADE